MVTDCVVIPVYNAEKYLESCLESVLNQKSTSAFEVILVNDGSKDSSPEICDRYGAQHSCITVIHQPNQGVSAARNAGLAAAKAQYVLFLDSDDCWKPDMLQTMDAVIAHQPDMAVVGYEQFWEDGTGGIDLPPVEAAGMTGEEYVQAHSKKGCMPIVTCWSAAFRREFLMQHDLKFLAGISYGEDFYFHMSALKRAQSVYSIRKALYCYRENPQSITHTPTRKKTQDLLTMCAGAYRIFPCAMLADYYCMNILNLGKHSKADAAQLLDVLRENEDILRAVSGKKPRIARMLYRILGYYRASRLVRGLIDAREAKT